MHDLKQSGKGCNMQITEKYLLSDSWDIINCKISLDVDGLVDWYNIICEAYKHLRFDFSVSSVLKEEYVTKDDTYGYDNVLKGNIFSWTLDWPVEKELPIPPVFAANEDLFPELKENQKFVLQEKYKFGYFNDVCKKLGSDFFKYSRITVHDTNAVIEKHTDGIKGIRVHIPIISNNESKFLFGEKLDREYVLEPGNVYIINTQVPHSTVNKGPTRAHIITDPGIDKILGLLNA